ncbi:MAG: diacylglycerol kinase family protein [Actinomycetota bacterium]
MRVTLIVNPFASSVNHRTRVRIQQLLGEQHDLTVVETTKGGHAIRLAHGAERAGAEVIIALGGDGTINEVANGVLQDGTDGTGDGDRPGAAIVPLPGGSTNVFARSLGYPNDPVAATSVLVDGLKAQSFRRANVGLANGRAFLFHVGSGFDAAVVARVERRGPLKRWAGHPLFIAAAVATWVRGVDRVNPPFTLATDDGRINDGAHLAIALNCNPYTFLGSRPLDLAPEATLDEPISLVTLQSLALHRLVAAAIGALRNDTGVPDGGATNHWPSVTGATIAGFRPFHYQMDGEYMGMTSELRIEHRPNAVTLVMPPPDHSTDV